MKILLDTHVLIWLLTEPERVSKQAIKELEKPDNIVYVSAASTWEMSIKQSAGKLDIPDDFKKVMQHYRFTELPITIEHTIRVKELPLLHKDPFDRLLVAQAIEEKLTLVTRDSLIEQYAIKTLKA
jgi:PIN domain nuclease of toxin-antitoxin system